MIDIDKKIHRCINGPLLVTIGWRRELKKWTLITSIVREETSFMFDTPIIYCPYCGEKLEEPENDD